jgi:signal transduction histidine kinase
MYPTTQPPGGNAAPVRDLGPPLARALPTLEAPPPPGRDLRQLLGWFIRVRWVFVCGLVLAVATAVNLFRIRLEVGKILAIAVVIASYNVLFAAYHRHLRRWPAASAATGNAEAGLQIALDLVALTVLLHFMGGGTSPLVCLYLIHANAGVMLLPRREAWLLGAGTFGLFLSLVVLESGSITPSYALTGVSADPGQQETFRVVLALTMAVTLTASMAITSTIMRGLRLRERQLQDAYSSLTEKQMQLVQTEKHASLGRLVAGIAHEINNPIQFIHGNMALLSEAFGDVLPLLDAEAGRRPDLKVARLEYPFFRKQLPLLLQDMSDGAERIGTIVRELRSFARNDEGRLDEAVDLARVVRASLRLLHNRLKHYRVEEDLDPALPELRGNVAQLQQVVVNALQNAAQALPADGTGRIAVRARTLPDGAWVALSVEDNGCGIPPEIQARIFDPFFTTRQAAGGSGLGLAIIEGILQQHRGRIEVDSQVGRGTVFRFLLPVKERGAA